MFKRTYEIIINYMLVNEATEQSWMASLQQGRPEALSLLYDKYAPILLGLITRMVSDPDVAETVLQKTFASIWLRKEEYPITKLTLLSWLILITRDEAKAAMLPFKAQVFSMSGEMSTFATGTNAHFEEPREQQLQEFCCRLKENEKKALQLVYLKGFTCKEAATHLGITVEELKIILKTAVNQLGAEKAT